MERKLLGIGAGQPEGSAELLLKVALRGAEAAGATVELVRLDDLRLPSGPDAPEPDDAWWLWDRLLDADAVVYATPIVSRTLAARLKLVADKLLGPNADAAFVEELLRLRAAGVAPKVPFRVDERVLKPRVAGFLAVGGSLTSQWKTLALPLLHTLTFSMHTTVVDQVVFGGAGTPRSIVLDDEALERAEVLGRHVASQVGQEDPEYLGEPGLCPLCHLDVVVLRGRSVECATCGARGELVIEGDDVRVRFDSLTTSVITMDEKRDHFFEVQRTAAKHAARRAEIDARAAELNAYDRLVRPFTPTT